MKTSTLFLIITFVLGIAAHLIDKYVDTGDMDLSPIVYLWLLTLSMCSLFAAINERRNGRKQ